MMSIDSQLSACNDDMPRDTKVKMLTTIIKFSKNENTNILTKNESLNKELEKQKKATDEAQRSNEQLARENILLSEEKQRLAAKIEEQNEIFNAALNKNNEEWINYCKSLHKRIEDRESQSLTHKLIDTELKRHETCTEGFFRGKNISFKNAEIKVEKKLIDECFDKYDIPEHIHLKRGPVMFMLCQELFA